MDRPMTSDQLGQLLMLLIVAGLVALAYYRRPWQGSSDAYGTAGFMTEAALKNAGMMAGVGLPLGRTLGTKEMLWHPRYFHMAVFAPPGAGKNVSFCTPWLLTYERGSCLVLDPKGELHQGTAKARMKKGQLVVRLDPFGVCGKGAPFNPLDLIGGGPSGIDHARAMAEAIVVRTGEEKDPHWNDKGAEVIAGVLAFILADLHGTERTLVSLREILCDEMKLEGCAHRLVAMGGIYADFGGIILALKSDEKASVISTCQRHTQFLSSPAIIPALQSGWDAREFTTGSLSLYLVLPPTQLEAQSRWLRLVIASLVRLVLREGMGAKEALFLLDEAGTCLGSHMPAIEQALVVGRSFGIRMCMFYQSLAQLEGVFGKEKQSIVLDSCDTVFFGVQSFETAEKVSQMMGEQTIVTEDYSESEGHSRQVGGFGENRGVNYSDNRSHSYKVHGRKLLTPDEVMRYTGTCLIAFLRNMRPIICARTLYYQDPLFTGKLEIPRWLKAVGLAAWLVLMVYLASLISPYMKGNTWQPRNNNSNNAPPQPWQAWPPQP